MTMGPIHYLGIGNKNRTCSLFHAPTITKGLRVAQVLLELCRFSCYMRWVLADSVRATTATEDFSKIILERFDDQDKLNAKKHDEVKHAIEGVEDMMKQQQLAFAKHVHETKEKFAKIEEEQAKIKRDFANRMATASTGNGDISPELRTLLEALQKQSDEISKKVQNLEVKASCPSSFGGLGRSRPTFPAKPQPSNAAKRGHSADGVPFAKSEETERENPLQGRGHVLHLVGFPWAMSSSDFEDRSQDDL